MMTFRRWTIDVFVDGRLHLRATKRFWYKKNAVKYVRYLDGLKKYHPSEAYRRLHRNYTYYVTR